MIIYIHGFGSNGMYDRINNLRMAFKSKGFLAPSLQSNPKLAIETLKEIIENCKLKNEKVYLIGTSLGGYYALILSNMYDIPAVVINPSIYPYETLKNSNKDNLYTNYFDNTKFEFNKKHIDLLIKYKPLKYNVDKTMLLLQKGDELLDYKVALEVLNDSKMIILENGGSHQYEGIERHIDEITHFFNSFQKN